MGRTVSDVALLLNGLAAVDANDPAAAPATGKLADDYTSFLKADALQGKRIGMLRQGMGLHRDVDAAVESAIGVLKSRGAEVVDVKMATFNQWNEAEFTVLLYQFKDGLNAYLKNSGAPHSSLEALIAYNKANAQTVMPFFGQEIFEQAQAKGPLTDAAYIKARDGGRRLAGKDGLIATLDTNKLDAIIAPTMTPAWVTDLVLGDHFIQAGYGLAAAAVAGTPSITVPMGEVRGLPVGLTFLGRGYSEGPLIALAYAFEQATKARKPPQYKPTLAP